ncbi:MAG TPA: plasmid pRiA4b ORF-3 family protein [Pseudonocardia sp.]|jgi:hypothetical protein|nr:plasmid pRiA4b ORF-3 family protein [Pseudonocardia sp.]
MTAVDAPAIPEAAQGCALLVRARALAGFVGSGRPVTAKAVLRRADIPPACTAAGLPDPGRVVSAAHVPALHRAWVAALGASLIEVGLRDVRATTPPEDVAVQWRSAVAAVLRAESDDPARSAATVVCRAALDVLAAAPGLGDRHFGDALDAELDRQPISDRLTVGYAFRRGLLPEVGAVEVLTECGVLDPTTRVLTPLGHWARHELTNEPAAPRPVWTNDDVLQLRIDLDRFRPPVWRRVRLPAATTLAELHQIIQILFEWDDDHLHVFTVDGMSYTDPSYGLGRYADEELLTLAAALPRAGARLSYRYDLGDCWDHTVLLEAGERSVPATRPTCLDGRGAAPVEDWPGDEPPPPRPFHLAALNRHLTGLGAEK